MKFEEIPVVQIADEKRRIRRPTAHFEYIYALSTSQYLFMVLFLKTLTSTGFLWKGRGLQGCRGTRRDRHQAGNRSSSDWEPRI